MSPGLALPQDPSLVVEWARHGERAGFRSLWLTDEPDFDVLPAMAAAARVTTQARLGVAGIDVTRRPPSLLAKALATLDVLSRGRLTIGLRATPDPAQLNEAITILRELFAGGPFTFVGTYWSVTGARCLPRPVQRPHPPIGTGTAGERVVTASDLDDVSVLARACNLG